MTPEQREKIQRAIGMIEGITYYVEDIDSDALCNAIELLDSILEDDKAK
jgi:hypothetical protein